MSKSLFIKRSVSSRACRGTAHFWDKSEFFDGLRSNRTDSYCYNLSVQKLKIAGNLFLIVYLWVTLCAFLFTVIRISYFVTFPRPLIIYSYGMTAPYQSARAPHGDLKAECEDAAGEWSMIDLEQFYPQMFGEANARRYFAVFSYVRTAEADQMRRARYADALKRILAERGVDCRRIRLTWESWPVMTGPFDALHQPTFTTPRFLYTTDAE